MRYPPNSRKRPKTGAPPAPATWKAVQMTVVGRRLERLYTTWVRISDAREEYRRTNKQAVADSSEGYTPIPYSGISRVLVASYDGKHT